MPEYRPSPIDTSEVALSPELDQLTERLAQNIHDNWARQRMHDGWRFGQARDDHERQHPCLVPYDDLPESEKEYDRLSAMESLKAIVALGYRIDKA